MRTLFVTAFFCRKFSIQKVQTIFFVSANLKELSTIDQAYNTHFVRTGKRLLLIFLDGRPAAQMPNRYMAKNYQFKLSIMNNTNAQYVIAYDPKLISKAHLYYMHIKDVKMQK